LAVQRSAGIPEIEGAQERTRVRVLAIHIVMPPAAGRYPVPRSHVHRQAARLLHPKPILLKELRVARQRLGVVDRVVDDELRLHGAGREGHHDRRDDEETGDAGHTGHGVLRLQVGD
jgi:hypothetical protein